MRKYLLVFAAILLLVSVVSAFADDLNPPSWRGQAGTTWGIWEFNTNNPNPLPDQGYNPYGTPSTQVTPGLFQSWQPNWGGRSGVWPLSGEIWITIPNNPVANPYKDIWVQLTWAEQATGNTPLVLATAPENTASSLVNQVALGGGWYHSTYSIRLYPNPNQETLLITGGINVDQLVIDTRCVPEPSSILALSAGLIGLVLRKRR